ncbi:DUF6194 family protein [Goodfellowiella coeruleoviolacea]|uniref:DUF6194 domain-containing protein n=1 Tax=Goodfellowiella coeruleoviolacea TaxID=334858 RepID=A0AAE3KET1_9PSEU|nr:DUF6194 family protein [Goodfellowiella coeruleoviolacea]MCP2165651.1 hypothetical protein [Goodfellowiella coeruleoviolacea]
MDADQITRYIRETFAGIRTLEANGDTFFLYDPESDLPPERQMPFATIVTGDTYDSVSNLSEPGAYRLNIGLTRATYTALFGAAPKHPDEHGVFDTGFDYAERDRLTPHPIYAGQHWVSVVNPSEATMADIRPLLAEAHDFAVRKYDNHRARQSG